MTLESKNSISITLSDDGPMQHFLGGSDFHNTD